MNQKKIIYSPEFRFSLSEREVHLWLISITEVSDKINSLASILSPAEMEQANNFVFEKDKKRSIVSKGLIKCILGKYNNTPPQQITFTYNEFLKPFLCASCNSNNIFFNISHSGDFILFAISNMKLIGVDIEQKNVIIDFNAIVQKFFSKKEINDFKSIPAPLRQNMFLKYWVCKEAYVKALGKGISHTLNEFSLIFNKNENIYIEDLSQNDGGASWSLNIINIDKDYESALAVKAEVENFCLFRVNKNNICHLDEFIC